MPAYRIIIGLLLGISLRVSAQEHPGVRNAHSMVYHSAEKAVYLFGGATDQEVKGDLWKWQNERWALVANEGPATRTFAAMVYDSISNRIILFGGSKVLFGKGPDTENLLNDTWIYAAGEWKEVEGDIKPKARAEAAYTFDPVRARLVLFGGYEIRGNQYIPLGDTWEFDGAGWKESRVEGPAPRNNAVMTFDAQKQVAVLFGGSTGRSGYGKNKGETWDWDGRQWVRRSITQPENIYNATMISTDEGLLRCGGWNGQVRVMELWTLTNDGWEELATNPAPHHRNHTQMVYEAHMMRGILYGGHDGATVFGDLWSLPRWCVDQTVDYASITPESQWSLGRGIYCH